MKTNRFFAALVAVSMLGMALVAHAQDTTKGSDDNEDITLHSTKPKVTATTTTTTTSTGATSSSTGTTGPATTDTPTTDVTGGTPPPTEPDKKKGTRILINNTVISMGPTMPTALAARYGRWRHTRVPATAPRHTPTTAHAGKKTSTPKRKTPTKPAGASSSSATSGGKVSIQGNPWAPLELLGTLIVLVGIPAGLACHVNAKKKKEALA